MILPQDKLREITGKARKDAQRRELDHLRIPYRVRRDGSLMVLLQDVERTKYAAQREPEIQP